MLDGEAREISGLRRNCVPRSDTRGESDNRMLAYNSGLAIDCSAGVSVESFEGAKALSASRL